MPVPIRKLSDVNLLSFIFFDDVHSVLNLGIQVIDDSIFFVDFRDFFNRNVDGFYKHSRPWIKTILEVTLVVESDDLLVSLWELLVDSIPVIETLPPFSDVILSDSPAIEGSVFELTFINEFWLLVHFAISVKFGVFEFALINELVLKSVDLTVAGDKRERRGGRLTQMGRMGMNDELFISDRDGLFLT